MTTVRIVGDGRAGGSLATALRRLGWPVEVWHHDADLSAAATGTDLLVLATPDAAVEHVATRVQPDEAAVVCHLSGVLGLGPLAGHPRRAVLHPLVALPDPARGADRLGGAWFGLAEAGDPLADDVVRALDGRAVRIAEEDWVRYHAAAVVAANHLVALLGQVERIAAGVGAPLAAYLDLARGSLEDVLALGPAAALTGPVRRGDTDTVARHLAALPEAERAAYRALSEEAARLCR